jgi:hypothetical protein
LTRHTAGWKHLPTRWLTDNGIEQDFSETTNYLSGKAMRTVFSGAKTSKNIRLINPRKAFPLSDFPPNGPEAAYAELQH